ncbi:hypothetical protein DL93DRAFT_2086057 [Clavulina sp. PMI_390]|nr:hypothetical protein DL93DRAFT_2086057 [Clavulina sp. PMI_390]
MLETVTTIITSILPFHISLRQPHSKHPSSFLLTKPAISGAKVERFDTTRVPTKRSPEDDRAFDLLYAVNGLYYLETNVRFVDWRRRNPKESKYWRELQERSAAADSVSLCVQPSGRAESSAGSEHDRPGPSTCPRPHIHISYCASFDSDGYSSSTTTPSSLDSFSLSSSTQFTNDDDPYDDHDDDRYSISSSATSTLSESPTVTYCRINSNNYGECEHMLSESRSHNTAIPSTSSILPSPSTSTSSINNAVPPSLSPSSISSPLLFADRPYVEPAIPLDMAYEMWKEHSHLKPPTTTSTSGSSGVSLSARGIGRDSIRDLSVVSQREHYHHADLTPRAKEEAVWLSEELKRLARRAARKMDQGRIH